jgi:glycosyltransferase involved in cell wall biosynthesis
MKNFPLVSVVVASYNHADFIISALDSVASQTYPNLELIIVDDCSKDSSVSKVKTWVAKPKNKKRFVRLIIDAKEINSGAHNTLNKGASLAEGKFVNFLNSDDLFLPNRIESLVDLLIQSNACWGFSGVNVIDDEDIEIPSVKLPPEVGFVYEGIEHARKNYPSLSCGLLERNFVVSTGNLFVDTVLFRQVGGFRDLKYLHDWDFILHMIRLAEPVAIDEPLYSYRLHGTNSFKSLANVAAVEGAFVMQEYFRSLAIGTPNALAPSPRNWSVLFDLWVDSIGLRHFV